MNFPFLEKNEGAPTGNCRAVEKNGELKVDKAIGLNGLRGQDRPV